MAEYIKKNTSKKAVFFNNYYLRAAAQRSVLFDSKGANILVEGNPQKLIEWNKAKSYLKNISEEERIEFLKKEGVTHFLSQK